jgi:hypothetical protein
MITLLSANAGKITAGGIAALLYVVSLPMDVTEGEKRELVTGLSFHEFELEPAGNGRAFVTERKVHPRLERIVSWISSVGAGIALADLDGDGLPNDACLVDPRNDGVTVRPLPGTGDRYPPFALPMPTAGYDPNTIAPMGCLAGDVNEDGRTDLIVYYWGRTAVAFLATARSPGPPQYRPVEIVAERERWFSNAAAFADVDGDGHADLIVGNYFPDGSRILDVSATDGVEMQHSMSRAFNGGRNRLLLWGPAAAGDVRFGDASDAFSPEMANGWTLALGAADLDGDLLPEIYVANDFGPDRLLHNRSRPGEPAFSIAEGRRDFTVPRSRVLGQDSFKGMGVDFGDVDGDGRLDIYVSNIAEEYALLESHFLFLHTGAYADFAEGVAPFQDASGRLGLARSAWSWDTRLADLNNDGHLEALQATGFLKGEADRWPELQELAMGNDELLKFPEAWHYFGPGADLSGDQHDRIYVADASGRFHDVAPILGLGEATVSRGIAVADVDCDGDLDVAIARQWSPSSLLLNELRSEHSALVLDLRFSNANGTTRPAIGALAVASLPDGRRLVGQADGGNGHSGRRAPEIHFGLGTMRPRVNLAVELRWRDEQGAHRSELMLPPSRHRIVLEGHAIVAEAGCRQGRDRPWP